MIENGSACHPAHIPPRTHDVHIHEISALEVAENAVVVKAVPKQCILALRDGALISLGVRPEEIGGKVHADGRPFACRNRPGE